ncbi:MAG TPA: sugar porter family MFS transporter [Victivallales bacterium]|nr:sugar porter family MFS transporter [Victivallales bacterium]
MSVKPNAKKIVITACIFAGLGGLLFGLDQGFINGSLQYISKDMHLTLSQGESFASIMLVGCIVGALCSGWISRGIGRKKTLILAALFFTVFTLFGALTHSVHILFATRFCLGLAVGCASFVVPLYLAEIAPTKMRGAFITMYQLMITIGIFLIFLSNSIISHYLQDWRLMLGVIVIPSIVMLIGVIFIPKSPRWLMLKGKEKDAKNVLESTRESDEEVEFVLTEIKESIKVDSSKKETGWTMLRKPYFLKVLFLGIFIMILTQFSGINAIIYYSGNIFKTAGFSNPSTATVIMGLINVIVTIIAVKYIDRLGRKPIIYFGLTLMTIMLIVIGILFHMQDSGMILSSFTKLSLVVCCLIFVASFAVSMGPIPWVICAEIFPLEGRDFGITITTAACWLSAAIVVRFSMSIMHYFGNSTMFFIFAACCIINFVMVLFWVPETKGVSLEELELNLKKGAKLKNIGK